MNSKNKPVIELFGVPYDGTTSYRPGARFGPEEIRRNFYGLETYSPVLDMDLQDFQYEDSGDLDIPIGNREKTLDMTYHKVKEILEQGKTPAMLGGEHLITLPSYKAVYEKYNNLVLVHFDAHTDLREDYLGETLSHASVIKRCWEISGDGTIFQFGIRSGEKYEFDWSKDHTYMERYTVDTVNTVAEKLKGRKIYITVDLDILDPSAFPGTGTPEPGGISFNELINALYCFRENEIVGFDIVELCPAYDNSGVSTAVACKVLREMLLIYNS